MTFEVPAPRKTKAGKQSKGPTNRRASKGKQGGPAGASHPQMQIPAPGPSDASLLQGGDSLQPGPMSETTQLDPEAATASAPWQQQKTENPVKKQSKRAGKVSQPHAQGDVLDMTEAGDPNLKGPASHHEGAPAFQTAPSNSGIALSHQGPADSNAAGQAGNSKAEPRLEAVSGPSRPDPSASGGLGINSQLASGTIVDAPAIKPRSRKRPPVKDVHRNEVLAPAAPGASSAAAVKKGKGPKRHGPPSMPMSGKHMEKLAPAADPVQTQQHLPGMFLVGGQLPERSESHVGTVADAATPSSLNFAHQPSPRPGLVIKPRTLAHSPAEPACGICWRHPGSCAPDQSWQTA